MFNWDWGYSARTEGKRVGFFWSIHLWPMPRPYISFYWELNVIEVSFGLGTHGVSDDVLMLGFTLTMSDRVAEWLYITCKRLRLVK